MKRFTVTGIVALTTFVLWTYRSEQTHLSARFQWIADQGAETVRALGALRTAPSNQKERYSAAVHYRTFQGDNGLIGGDVSHAEGAAEIILGSDGEYGIWFQVLAEEPNVVTAYQNGSPIPGGTFGVSIPFSHYPGNLIVSASAGDVITFRNTGLLPITLQVLTSPVQAATNAGVVIGRLS